MLLDGTSCFLIVHLKAAHCLNERRTQLIWQMMSVYISVQINAYVHTHKQVHISYSRGKLDGRKTAENEVNIFCVNISLDIIIVYVTLRYSPLDPSATLLQKIHKGIYKCAAIGKTRWMKQNLILQCVRSVNLIRAISEFEICSQYTSASLQDMKRQHTHTLPPPLFKFTSQVK